MNRPVRRALLSVSDKTGLTSFAQILRDLGVEIISTGGTAVALRNASIPVVDVACITGFPEIMDGRVKTLHPNVHGGLLAIRGNAAHETAQARHGIGDIDLLVVNLYPFEETVARGADWNTAIENIDVGGPAMIRAAAKNHQSVTLIVDPGDYESVAAELTRQGATTSEALRKRLAAKAFARTAAYDAAIARWFGKELDDLFPEYLVLGGRRLQTLRYGENPHQRAAFYSASLSGGGVGGAFQLQGKELSYNNLNDTDAALHCVGEFPPSESAACVIIKHANPCGVGMGSTVLEAYRKALRCDPVSAFGGIVAFNRTLDDVAAREVLKVFTEVIVAPSVSDEAKAIISEKQNLRLLLADGGQSCRDGAIVMKTVAGGFLVQTPDDDSISFDHWRVVTRRAPSDRELADLKFAWRVAKHVKSNAIVYARDGATVGIGAGQMSRVDSVRIAARKSEAATAAAGLTEPLLKGSVVASDAFFPFADGLLQAAEAGATAIVQPGGSMRDEEVVRAADHANLAMIFTGVRHFRH